MLEKLKVKRQNFHQFQSTKYYQEFIRNIYLSFIPFLFFLFIWVFSDNILVNSVNLLFFIFYLAFLFSYGNYYYQTVIITVLKMEEMKEKYSLIDADKMTSYETSLSVILNLIDASLEREYSNRLLQKQAEFDAMKSQINPHFLYNTLDTIRGYAMMENAPLTSDMIEVLSRLFRYSISQKNELIPIRQELSILYDYIKIQEYRINQHIVFLEEIDPDLNILDYKIPKLIIQPFIENAIKHGLKNMAKEFIITLQIYRTQSHLIISISDNGSGMTTEQLKLLNQKLAEGSTDSIHSLNPDSKKKGTGIALTNVNSRIKLIYGESYGVFAYSTLGIGSEFQIILPY